MLNTVKPAASPGSHYLPAMKHLRTLPVYLLIPLCLGLSAAFQLAWLRQLVRAQRLGSQQELEAAVSLVAERSVFASELTQNVPMTPYRALFLSPAWGRLRTAFDNLHVPQVVNLLCMISRRTVRRWCCA